MLLECSECKTLWVEIPYEPHGSFPYWVKWNYSEEDWQMIHEMDNGKTIFYWHLQEIRDKWQSLSKEDLEAIEEHRKRAYYRNSPIDIESKKRVNLEKIINSFNQ